MKTCKICGKPAQSDYCFSHKPRKPLKGKRLVSKRKQRTEENKEDAARMKQLFLSIWQKRPHYSEVSREYLGPTPLTTFFHHILLKSVVEEAKFDESNIILLTPQEHQTVHIDMHKYEEINKRRKLLKEKYELI